MPDSNREPHLLPIERPRCPKCQGRMMFARLELDPASRSEVRTFECPKCDHVLQLTADDPMKSDAAAWANSDLNPPQ